MRRPRRLPAYAVIALGLVTLLGLQSSGASFTSLSTRNTRVTAAADWTPPAVAVTNPGSYVNGIVTVSAPATDSISPIASVMLQYAPNGTENWTTLCTDTTAPYSCTWNTVLVADGRYDLRAIAKDTAGNQATSDVVTTRVVNTASVVLTDPGDNLRGAVPLRADFVGGQGAPVTMRIEFAVTGSTNWNTIPGCGNAVVTSTYTCTWVTSGAETYDLRAVAVVGVVPMYDVRTYVSVDNIAPTVALTVPAGPLSGTITLSAVADDADSGVDTVSFQYRTVGSPTWVICGNASTMPYGCQFNTAAVADGNYEFRAIATDLAGNTTTTATQTRTIDNTIATVSITSPVAGAVVTGTVTVSAAANSNRGVTSVLIEARPSGGTWAALCTDTTAPYTCSWPTTVSGTYELRATMTQGNGALLTSATVSVTVDNSVLKAADVQAANVGTIGLPSTGDRIVLTYSSLVDLTTIKAGWTGASTGITVDLKDKKVSGASVAGFDRAEFTGTNLGQVAFGQNYLRQSKSASFTGSTMVASTATVGGVQVTVITVTLGTTTQSASLRVGNASGYLKWTPTAAVKTPTGVACSTVAATETGALDKDL